MDIITAFLGFIGFSGIVGALVFLKNKYIYTSLQNRLVEFDRDGKKTSSYLFEHIKIVSHIDQRGTAYKVKVVTFYSYQKIINADYGIELSTMSLPPGKYFFEVKKEDRIILRWFDENAVKETFLTINGNIDEGSRKNLEKVIAAIRTNQ